MKNISDEVLSLEEAKAALRCMRLCSFDEEEALESIDSFIHRIRKVGMAKLIEIIVEKHLSSTQKLFFKEYWYNKKILYRLPMKMAFRRQMFIVLYQERTKLLK